MGVYTTEFGAFITPEERENLLNHLNNLTISFECITNPMTEAIEAFRNFSLVTASALNDTTDNQNKKGDLEIFKGKPIIEDEPIFRRSDRRWS